MKNHTKVYISSFGYDETDFIPSELGGKANDVHHIDARGMGGDPSGEKDRIENLMALTRQQHIHYGDKVKFKPLLFKKHLNFLKKEKVSFDESYILDKIKFYETLNSTV